MPRALYLHVPFCPSICPYCDFHKMKRQEGLVAAYLRRLKQEAAASYEAFPGPLDTIYFGGGTPSHLTDAELAAIVAIFTRTWGWPGRLETTLEADPLTFDAARLKTLKALGFSRLSIGVQSSQEAVLRFLGRQHSGREGLEAVFMALAAGFAVSADLITAVPGQDVLRDLRALAQTGVPHLSVYSLTIEPYTPFALRGIRVDPDQDADAYLLVQEILPEYGLRRYEVSNHARPGCESRHNQVYWHGEFFLGLGPSAASFLPRCLGGGVGERRINPPIKGWLRGDLPEIVAVGGRRYLEDVLMTGLRTRRGVDLAALSAKSGLEVEVLLQDWLARYSQLGWLTRQGPVLQATPAGLIRLNRLVQELLA
ncbi:MAG: radical SAM family heme chaperone HemW [Truepera sp.]|nr:radical SAM family heme chaperone HemW [Truepera sp.]